MPKKKEKTLTPKEQYERFKDAAKKAEITTCEEEFGRTVKKIARSKRLSKQTSS